MDKRHMPMILISFKYLEFYYISQSEFINIYIIYDTIIFHIIQFAIRFFSKNIILFIFPEIFKLGHVPFLYLAINL